MKRVIVDYAKLTNEILTLLVEKFPDGYDDSDIIRFKNAKNETVEAVEVRTEDTIYLVKVSTKLADRIENFDDEDDTDVLPVDALPVTALKDIDIDDSDDEDDEDFKKSPGNEDDEEDEDEDFDSDEPIDEDEEEEL